MAIYVNPNCACLYSRNMMYTQLYGIMVHFRISTYTIGSPCTPLVLFIEPDLYYKGGSAGSLAPLVHCV
jgi:hypothetical protein